MVGDMPWTVGDMLRMVGTSGHAAYQLARCVPPYTAANRVVEGSIKGGGVFPNRVEYNTRLKRHSGLTENTPSCWQEKFVRL
jgi:hypothetical protein